jgi:hypothetical protein
MLYRPRIISNLTPLWIVIVILAIASFSASPAFSQSGTVSTDSTIPKAAANGGLLDGRQFKAGIIRADAENDGKQPTLGDELIFSNGKFSSAVCKRYNFAEAPYWVRVEGDQVHFLAELTSPTDGKMVWKGTVRGDTLEGTMRWTKERWYWTIDTEHKIRGTRETEPIATSRPTN